MREHTCEETSTYPARPSLLQACPMLHTHMSPLWPVPYLTMDTTPMKQHDEGTCARTCATGCDGRQVESDVKRVHCVCVRGHVRGV
mgnify:FL=1